MTHKTPQQCIEEIRNAIIYLLENREPLANDARSSIAEQALATLTALEQSLKPVDVESLSAQKLDTGRLTRPCASNSAVNNAECAGKPVIDKGWTDLLGGLAQPTPDSADEDCTPVLDPRDCGGKNKTIAALQPTPAIPDAAREKCDTCGGKGQVYNNPHAGDIEPAGIAPCPACRGFGTIVRKQALSSPSDDLGELLGETVRLLRKNAAWCDDDELIDETDRFLDKYFPKQMKGEG